MLTHKHAAAFLQMIIILWSIRIHSVTAGNSKHKRNFLIQSE